MIKKNISFLFFLLIMGSSVLAQERIIVQINTQPDSAQIFIDGNELDREDMPFFIVEGKHQIEIKSEGYFSQSSTIKVNRKKYRFSFALKRDKSKAIPIPVDVVDVEKHGEEVISVDSSAPVPVPVPASAPVSAPIEVVKVVSTVIPENDYNFEMEMVDVVGGYFLMGYKYGGLKHKVHTVKIPNFMIGKYEVTQEQWVAIMGENPSKFINDKYPVENVSWLDVRSFITKLNEKTGEHYRLPTEAEWEYAARGGQKRKSEEHKFSGSNELDEVGWNWRNSGDSILVGRWDLELLKKNKAHPHIGGEKKPNELGICDMSGNLWEWCSDWYSEDYYTKSPKDNPKGPEVSKNRVYRGGSFVSKRKQCMVHYRFSAIPKYGYIYLGFRLVKD